MNITRWFNTSFTISRRQDATDWGPSSYLEVGTGYGFFQPVGAGLTTRNGAISDGQIYTLYCPAETDLIEGDRVRDDTGTEYICMESQPAGVSGISHHMEALLSLERT